MALLYVSKIDTTGLLPTSAPSRVLTTSLLQYYLLHHPHAAELFRVHVFARSQDQYLFPGSIDNKAKRVLDDTGLCIWWRSVLGEAASRLHSSTPPSGNLKLFYLLGGCTYQESLPLLGKATLPDNASALQWVYGHPYRSIPSPLPGKVDQLTLNDLIPAFQDDPKSRYLTSLTSSPVPAAGDQGDYDDVMEQLHKRSDTSNAIAAMRMQDMEQQRNRERSRLVGRNVDEYWECMGGRQECCAGHVAGFFVLASEKTGVQKNTGATPPMHTTPEAAPASFSHSNYVRLWSAIHNVNYASITKTAEAYVRWSADMRHAASRSGISDEGYLTEVIGRGHVDNPVVLKDPSLLKRTEPPKSITTLQVKKKKQKLAAN